LRSSDIQETEEFVAFRDEWGTMAIRPVSISGFWEHILEDDWYYMFEERPELEALFGRIRKQFKRSIRQHKTDIFKVRCEVRYSLVQPPGLEALQWGHHLGTSKDYMFKAKPTKPEEMQFITGFVRTISMEPLG
jgi:hypothetical protein